MLALPNYSLLLVMACFWLVFLLVSTQLVRPLGRLLDEREGRIEGGARGVRARPDRRSTEAVARCDRERGGRGVGGAEGPRRAPRGRRGRPAGALERRHAPRCRRVWPSLGVELDEASRAARAVLRERGAELARELASRLARAEPRVTRRLAMRVVGFRRAPGVGGGGGRRGVPRPADRSSGRSPTSSFFFGLLFYLLARPAVEVLPRSRREQIASQLKEAERASSGGRALRSEMDAAGGGALRRDRGAARSGCHVDGEREREAFERQGDAEAARLTAQIEQEAARRVADARRELASEAATVAAELALELLQRELNAGGPRADLPHHARAPGRARAAGGAR